MCEHQQILFKLARKLGRTRTWSQPRNQRRRNYARRKPPSRLALPFAISSVLARMRSSSRSMARNSCARKSMRKINPSAAMSSTRRTRFLICAQQVWHLFLKRLSFMKTVEFQY